MILAAVAQHIVESTEGKLDLVVATGAIGAWWWLPHFDNILHVALGVGGLALLLLRIVKAYKDTKRKN
jgi:hypothetical protein